MKVLIVEDTASRAILREAVEEKTSRGTPASHIPSSGFKVPWTLVL